MKIRDQLALTFDDVLLVPRRSPVHSRADVSTATVLSRHITLDIPIVSANMDTVTEAEMATALARAGGIGIIHRFMTAERQAEEVRRVKRAESHVVEAPVTIGPDAALGQARRTMHEEGIGGLVVLDGERRPLGILTQRDLELITDDSVAVSARMTPAARLVTAPVGTTLEDARRILTEHRLEKLPLLDAEGRLAGLITARDILGLMQHPRATKDHKGRLRVGAAIGVRPGSIERAGMLLEAGADVLVVDIAHGHSDNAIATVRTLRKQYGEVEIIAGNVATIEGTRDLIKAGADAVKVGIGPGSICITRVVTGFGVPQITAIAECADCAREYGVPIIADGGVRTSGDLVKALAAGAQSVMLGSLLAGTDESPGLVITRHGQRYKISRGMASMAAALGRPTEPGQAASQTSQTLPAQGAPQSKESPEEDPAQTRVVAEGVEAAVPYRGAVADMLAQLVGGLRSGLSYGGATSIAELQDHVEFVRITQAGVRESGPHDVDVL